MVITNEYYKKHAPDLKKYIKPSAKQLKKHPRLLYLVQYGDNEPIMVFGPDETREERAAKSLEKRSKQEHTSLLKKTKTDIQDRKQGTMTSYFKKCNRCKPCW